MQVRPLSWSPTAPRFIQALILGVRLEFCTACKDIKHGDAPIKTKSSHWLGDTQWHFAVQQESQRKAARWTPPAYRTEQSSRRLNVPEPVCPQRQARGRGHFVIS